MDKITFIKHLVRLSQIAEEIQEAHPSAAGLIDENINDISNNFGQQSVARPHDSLFPSSTPQQKEGPEEVEAIANEITKKIVDSGKIDAILDENPPDLDAQIKAVINQSINSFLATHQ